MQQGRSISYLSKMESRPKTAEGNPDESPLSAASRAAGAGTQPRRARLLWALAVLALLIILAVELLVPARQQAQTTDEANHLQAGARYWKYSDFGDNPEHPPLAKLVAALPVLDVPVPPPAPYQMFFKHENFESGEIFLYTHDADQMLWRSRAAVSVFTFALALLVLAAGYEIFGPAVGITALLIFVFEPTLLAHGALVTTDMAASCCFFAAIYAFYRWRTNPTPGRLAICGAATGLMLAAKHSGILMIPILAFLALNELSQAKQLAATAPENNTGKKSNRAALRMVGSLAVIFLMAYAILWAFYGFRYQARPGALAMVPTLAEYTLSPHSALAEAIIPRLTAWHLLPEAYLFGFVDILVAAQRDPMFLLGTDFATGQWFYFPVAFVIKSTLGFLALLALVPFLKIWQNGKEREKAFLAVPPVIYFVVCLASTMTIGIRHILPVYPFLILIAAAAAVKLFRWRRWGKYATAGLVLCHIASSAHAFPYYLTYSNEAWGGPANTFRLLTDSNADWNQSLREVKSYLDANHIQKCWFAHYGWDVDPDYYHIPCTPLPVSTSHYMGQPLPLVPASIEGTVLISGSEADGNYWGPGDLNPYEQFLHRRPDAIIANSVLVFHGQFDLSLVSALGHLSQAKQLASQQQWENALTEAHIAIDLAPKSAETHAVLGNILLKMNRLEDARREFLQAAALANADQPRFQYTRILRIPPEYLPK